MKKKQVIALLLALIITGTTFISCSDNNTNGDETTPSVSTPSSTETDGSDETETEPVISDDLPDVKFNGEDYIVLTLPDYSNTVYTEEMTGEGINDAVWQRNAAISERFDVNIKINEVATYDTATPLVETAVLGGDNDSFDIVSYHVVSNSSNAIKGYYMNWYDIPHINFEKPWWSDSNIEDLTINNVCFLAFGDMAVTTVSNAYCMFFNKREADIAGIGNIYDTVREGSWTLEKLKEICAAAMRDENGDGVMNENDFYGLASNRYSNVNAYLWAFDNPIFKKNSTGELEYSYYSEHLTDIVPAIVNLCTSADGVFCQDINGVNIHETGMDMFRNSRALMVNGYLEQAITHMSDFDSEYGIIPYPKYDTAQSEYKTMVDGRHEALAVSKAAQELEFIGTITEAMCAESYKTLLPAYFDVALKNRYADSPDDAEMIDIIKDGRVFDFGYVYDNWKGVSFILQTMVQNKTTDIVSSYKKGEKAYIKYYESIMKKFNNYNESK